MDVFDLRRRLISDYSGYIRSFIRVREERISRRVDEEIDGGLLWPEPLIQLNPAFEPGDWIDDLVKADVLHKGCAEVFRRNKAGRPPNGERLRLHRHQSDAIRHARAGQSYVLTTGTGSGKSLSYIVPIVDHVLRNGSGRGTQAIVVYPMNALANSQYKELEKFLRSGYPEGVGPVTFDRYTGQDSDEQKNKVIANPPDILLTNYVMLELILTRYRDAELVKHAQGLRFLVFDELHTYRGRQGADVSLLIRRAKDRLGEKNLLCVGTSATLASKGTQEQQRAEVARVSSQLFGTTISPENVIGETLRRATPEHDPTDKPFLAALTNRLASTATSAPSGHRSFTADPLSSWIESTFGVRREEGSGRLIRCVPRRIGGKGGAAADLAELTGAPLGRCEQTIKDALLVGYNTPDPETGFPTFAFRLHQFISKGDTVWATIEPEDRRHITFQAQKYVPGDRDKRLLPLAFCRECGQEYYVVRRGEEPGTTTAAFEPRDLLERVDDSQSRSAGYIYVSASNPWPEGFEDQRPLLPDDWIEEGSDGPRVVAAHRKHMPVPCRLTPDARDSTGGTPCHFIPGVFRFCLQCGVSYAGRRSEFAKLTTLGSEGRSTATTILSLAAIRHLRQDPVLPASAKKLLSFTDNRQDASLQAGHFNDFVEMGLLRSALLLACQRTDGLSHEILTEKVFEALDLPLAQYATDPDIKYQAKADTERALKDVLGYRLYRDLQRGWRITSPNLEQCGLLRIGYKSLDEVCADEGVWRKCAPPVDQATPKQRSDLARVLLDHMRRELAIKVDYLSENIQERIKQQSSQKLRAPWALDENDRMERATVLYPRSRRGGERFGAVYLSGRGGFGQALARMAADWTGTKPNLVQRQQVLVDLLEALRVAGLVEIVDRPKDDVPGYQLPASAMVWQAGDGGEVAYDPIRVPRAPKDRSKGNPFFVAFYRGAARETVGLSAREHTAQVPADERARREDAFRDATLPVLYCSPTMELGVDISELNVVNLRNIPPTPANYAQRSGRAGRSGQPALVFSYCSTSSQHDQYFFKRPERMVAGAVSAPRLDLANEDLVRSHVQAIWLAETNQDLHRSLKEILDLTGDQPTLELQTQLRQGFEHAPIFDRSRRRVLNVLRTIDTELRASDWFTPDWVDDTLKRSVEQFDRACERWRTLFRAAVKQRDLQDRIIKDVSRPAADKDEARRLRREAESQIELLTEVESFSQSDFYSYRYFASEGFLPGYNFPRLPLSAFLPGRPMRNLKDKADNYLSRPRFLAISEFGPRAVVYHEGSRFRITKVILSVDEGGQIATQGAKLCKTCGYLHPVVTQPGPDLCHRCGSELPAPMPDLFRLQNVSTRRTERINSDEEERLRLGFEIKTAVRFEERDGAMRSQVAEVLAGSEPIVKLAYGHAATIWRINLGWRRRANPNEKGFFLDLERGYWQKNDADDDDELNDPISKTIKRVIPYVEDHRNCLLFQPTDPLDLAVMAGLQAALKNAIQVEYQLEENELAAEPLPSLEDRRVLLFYEASEGGAGVLRRLVENNDAIRAVAQRALELLHFDPKTGDDRLRAEGARENCEAACYDCLMSYVNQHDHQRLDRQLVKGFLMQLASAQVRSAPGAAPRASHLAGIINLCQSELERDWLREVDSRNLRLPSGAQKLIERCQTRPDFIYEEDRVAIYVDGPLHDDSTRAARDAAQQEAMEDAGWQVIRFHAREDWENKFDQYRSIFGRPS